MCNKLINQIIISLLNNNNHNIKNFSMSFIVCVKILIYSNNNNNYKK